MERPFVIAPTDLAHRVPEISRQISKGRKEPHPDAAKTCFEF